MAPAVKGGDVLIFTIEIIKIKGGKKAAITCNPVDLKARVSVSPLPGPDRCCSFREMGSMARGMSQMPEITNRYPCGRARPPPASSCGRWRPSQTLLRSPG